MNGKHHISGKFRSSMLAGCVIGILVAAAVSALITGLQSGFIGSNKIGEGTTAAVIFMTRVLSVAAGCFLATSLTRNRILPVIGITTAGYLVLLLGIGITAFNGSFKNFGSGLLSVLLGGAIPCIIKLKTPKKSRNATYRR